MLSPAVPGAAAHATDVRRDVLSLGAARDPLTGCWTRETLFIELAARIRSADPSSGAPTLLLVDLDRFHTVNETAGNPVGDRVLARAAARIGATYGGPAAVARLNGDEFALIVSDPDPQSLAGELLEMLSRPYAVDGTVVTVGASIGIASAPRDGADADTLLRSASVALRRSKRAGGHRVTRFEASMMDHARHRRALELDLRAALAGQQVALRRAMAPEEFELHYQPQVSAGERRLVGFEALVRWRHPTRGMVPPNDFIPLTEELGLIGLLGDWVMRDACRFAARWPVSVPVAVNVSALQLLDGEALLASIDAALAASGLPPERLEVEITESALVADTAQVLQAIRARGVKLAMDDFGTGYSSLSQLTRLSFDRLKIDRSFVNALPGRDTAAGKPEADPRSNHANWMLEVITALGRGLGLSVLAEGVETEDQLAQLQAAGVADIQGYLISRPVPERQVYALIDKLACVGPRTEVPVNA